MTFLGRFLDDPAGLACPSCVQKPVPECCLVACDASRVCFYVCFDFQKIVTAKPDDLLALPDVWLALPDVWLALPDGFLAIPDGFLAIPDGWLTIPDGWMV